MRPAILLHAPLSPAARPGWAGALLAALPYAWRLRLESRPAAERVASLGGIALAVAAIARLAGATPRVRALLQSPEGKPRFASGPGFSISHTVDRVACVAAAAIDTGLDLETTAGGRDDGELQRWTATEAALKAAGLGLRQLGRVDLERGLAGARVGGRHYVLHHLRLADDCVTCVAAQTPLALTTEAVELDGPEVSAALERSLGPSAQ